MPREATRTATVYTRVDPETKRQAELILEQRGIPFEMKLSSSNPVAIGNMTKEQFDTEMQLGINDIQAGRVISADEIEAEMRNGLKTGIFDARSGNRPLDHQTSACKQAVKDGKMPNKVFLDGQAKQVLFLSSELD